MSQFKINASESALPFALEQYYAELTNLVGERSGRPLLLNNTITTFDINEKAPFYTEGVFRQFADRKFRESPSDLGTAIQADRYSFEYERVIEAASVEIDENLTADILQRIEANQREVARITRELIEFDKGVTDSWHEIVKSENLVLDSPNYNLRRINFFEGILYSDQRKTYTDEIGRYTRKINVIRSAAYSPAQKKLLMAKAELAEAYKIARPWNTYFERDIPASVFTFADQKYRSVQLCDISPSIYPSLNLVEFQQQTGGVQRGFSVSSTTVHNELHKSTWGAAGSGSFNAFGISIGGGGGGSVETSFKRDFTKIRNFSIGFGGIAEVYAQRGLWFDPSLFNDSELRPIFERIPGGRDLEFVAVSLIIVRGLSISLEFSDAVETERWSRRNFDGRGGVSIFGYSFGGSGSSSSYEYGFQMSNENKTVTFSDVPKHCRLVALRLERVYEPQKVDFPERHFAFGGKANLLAKEHLFSGKISPSNYQELKTSGFSADAVSRIFGDNGLTFGES